MVSTDETIYASQPEIVGNSLKAYKTINANTNAIVDAAMENIDAEYEALVGSYSLASV